MKLDLIAKVVAFVVLASFPFSIKAQIIDSVVHKPFANVDSIEYWHTVVRKDNNQEYFELGYYQSCNCTHHNFLNQDNYKSRDKHTIAEGLIVNGMKQGKWVYWNNVKGMCCDELQISDDSIVTYNLGRPVFKRNNYATFVYKENEVLEVDPYRTNSEFKFKIICKGRECSILLNNGTLIKTFDKAYIDEELVLISLGDYNFKARQKLEKNK